MLKTFSTVKNFIDYKIIALYFLIGSTAFGQDLEKARSLIQKIADQLVSFGAIACGLAVIWCGYKMLFMGATLKDIMPTILGGLLIGGGMAIGGMFFGSA